MTLTFRQRKTVEVEWDTDVVKGAYVSIEAGLPGEVPLEIRNVENDGHATVTFPEDFTGSSHIVVHGSHGGEDSGTVKVKKGTV